MADDFRNTLIGCASTFCRFNVSSSTERTCMLKLVAIGDTGRCLMAEGRPAPQPPVPAPRAPGHFEGGVWVK
jgi:hypothetical protein